MVGVRGFEPPAPASRKQCSTRLSYTPPTGRSYSENAAQGQYAEGQYPPTLVETG